MCFEKIHKSINVDQPKADVFSQGTHYQFYFRLLVVDVTEAEE